MDVGSSELVKIIEKRIEGSHEKSPIRRIGNLVLGQIVLGGLCELSEDLLREEFYGLFPGYNSLER